MANPNLGGSHQEEYDQDLFLEQRERRRSAYEDDNGQAASLPSFAQGNWSTYADQDENNDMNRFQSHQSSYPQYQEQDSFLGGIGTSSNPNPNLFEIGNHHASSFPSSSSSRDPLYLDSADLHRYGIHQNQAVAAAANPFHSQASHGYSNSPPQFNDPNSIQIPLPSTQNQIPNPYQLTPERYRDLLQQQMNHTQEHGDTTNWYPNPTLLPSHQPHHPQQLRHSVPSLDSFSTVNQNQSYQSFLQSSVNTQPQYSHQPPPEDHFRSHSFSYGDARQLDPPGSSSFHTATDPRFLYDQNRDQLASEDQGLIDQGSLNQFPSIPTQVRSQPQPQQPLLRLTHSKGKGKEREESQEEEEQEAGVQEIDEEGLDRDGGKDVDEGASKKRKTIRRQGVTCDQCRQNHVKCDLREVKEAITGVTENVQRSTKTMKEEFADYSCSRCSSKKQKCTKDFTAAPRNYARPGRSGRRIEQARLQHGTSSSSQTTAVASIPSEAYALNPGIQLVFPTKTRGESKVSSSIVGGWIAVHLLTCFFHSAHTQMPIMDANNFSKRFNHSNGNLGIMVLMANGGDEEHESAIPSAPGLTSLQWKDTRESKVSTLGTLETLIAAMQCAASHYSDAPTIFGPEGGKYLISKKGGKNSGSNSASSSRNQSVEVGTSASTGNQNKGGKRKQGVACDSCRVRRIKCDYWDRPPGAGCSRCAVKSIRCTDDFIQSRIAKGSNPNPNSNASSTSTSTPTSGSPSLGSLSTSSANQDQARPTEAPTAHFKEKDYDSQSMIALGKLRKPFVHQMLHRALELIEKNDILVKASVEGIQSLMILAPILAANDMLLKSREFAATACRHLKALNLVTRFTVDENDPVSIQKLLFQMHASRLSNTSWAFDSFWSGIYRVIPHLSDDEPIQFVNRAPTAHGEVPAFTAPLKPNSPAMSIYGDPGVAMVASRIGPIQSCALSRYVAKNIDITLSTSITDISPEERFPPTMTIPEIQRLSKSCHSFWRAVFALLSASDVSVSKALKGEDKFKESNPVLPISWAATTQISFISLLLSVYRVLGERLKVFGTSVQVRGARARNGLGTPPSMEEMGALKELKILFEISKSRTLMSCRRTAHLTAWLLPRHVFNTGYVRRQLIPISQFLANAPAQPKAIQTTNPDVSNPQAAGLASSDSSPPLTNVSPRSQHSQSSSQPSNHDSQSGFVKDQESREDIALRHLKRPNEDLGPYDVEAKKIEVGWVLEGIRALAYAWSDCEKHIQTAEVLLQRSLQADEEAARGGPGQQG